MKNSLNRRLSMLTVIFMIVGFILFLRLFSFQFDPNLIAYFQDSGSRSYRQLRDQIPDRGRIFDRNGELLATNAMDYKIGISPRLVINKARAAKSLAEILNLNEQDVFEAINRDVVYVALGTGQPVPHDVAQKVAALNQLGVVLDPVPRRIYPQGGLAAQVIGFVAGDANTKRGYIGVEGDYNNDLAGKVRVESVSAIPFEVNPNDVPPPGRDIYLTIDRSIQYLAETELQAAIEKYGATEGSIIIMDPRNGEVLAMASYPSFDPNAFYEVKPDQMRNSAVSDIWEPGSVFKIVTGSVALQSGKVTPDWTYYDKSPKIVGGRAIYNWDRGGHGSQNFVDVFVHSWNIGTSTLAVDVMGATTFYKGLQDFGVGARTGIDLEGEAQGILRRPGDTYWSDSDLATNSFGQGVSITPLQMLCFANTIANGGQMMQPHIRLKTVDGDRLIPAIPSASRTPISSSVAKTMTDIMVKVVNEGEGKQAAVKGYTIAGKTGTAQIPCATCKDGFDPELQNVSFVGFLPADAPRVSIIIKMNKVSNRFASETAAPAFSKLVQRLVVVMNIPTDEQRRMLRAQGGDPAQITGRSVTIGGR